MMRRERAVSSLLGAEAGGVAALSSGRGWASVGLRDELLVALAAMTPVGELRAAIPLAALTYDMWWLKAYALAVVGNLVPVPFVLFGLRTVGERIERQEHLVGRLLRWRTRRVEAQWGDRVRRLGFLGIVLVVAIPLPLTGAWTGTLAVWALGMPARRGLPAIAAGVAIAGAIVTALTAAGIGLVRLL